MLLLEVLHLSVQARSYKSGEVLTFRSCRWSMRGAAADGIGGVRRCPEQVSW